MGSTEPTSIRKALTFWISPDVVAYVSRLPLQDDTNAILAESLSEIIRHDEKADVLVVGGGAGRLGRLLVRKYPCVSVREIDQSEAMIAAANRLAFVERVADRFVSETGDVLHLPWVGDTFDHVFANGIVRYFDNEDQRAVITEMLRVSR